MQNQIQTYPNYPIGFFDSGLGGLTVLAEIYHLLPNEHLIYLADSKNAPYGEKSKKEIIALSIKNTEKLLALNCKIIVVACNTATTNAIQLLREKFNVPFIGIEPAIKPAALKSVTKKIGVLATKGTLSSDLFAKTTENYRPTHTIVEVEGNGLVELVEQGKINKTEDLLRQYLKPMLKQNVDNIVLGCTHYPMLIPIIKKLIPPNITIIDAGEAVAKQTKNILTQQQLLATQIHTEKHQFFTNGNNKEVLEVFLKKLLITDCSVQQLDF
ncbi:MAG: glutamate racemase [Vicingaceae bacterium]|nr:glutamate racemase [Vicingaceae bacterium]